MRIRVRAASNAAQLVKHYLGLRRRFQDRPVTLAYLYFDLPRCAIHAAEVREFTRRVSDPRVRFVAMSYRQLWDEWADTRQPPWLVKHVAALRRRYDAALSEHACCSLGAARSGRAPCREQDPLAPRARPLLQILSRYARSGARLRAPQPREAVAQVRAGDLRASPRVSRSPPAVGAGVSAAARQAAARACRWSLRTDESQVVAGLLGAVAFQSATSRR